VTVATRRDDATLACYSPIASVTVPSSPRPLEVALNARDFSASNVSFGYYADPHMDRVLPIGGPVGGDTLVAVRSRATGGLGGGSHYLCSFGDTVVPATYVGSAPPFRAVRGPHNNANLLATSDDKRPDDARALATPRDGRSAYAYISAHVGVGSAVAHGAVLCVSPPNASAAGSPISTLALPFAVALNGQNFHPLPSGFTYYVPPTVDGLAPTRGPSAGGTLITLALSAAVHQSLLNATSCRVGGLGDHLPYVHSRPVLARLSSTAQIADGVLQCAAPPAERVGAVDGSFFDFSDPRVAVGTLIGDAALVADRDRPCALGTSFSCGGSAGDGYTSATSAQCEWLCPIGDGHLKLTSGGYGSSGSWILNTPHVDLAPPPREINASFDLYVGRRAATEHAPHGDGSFTFNVGNLSSDTPIGLTGAARGLSVQFFFVGPSEVTLRLEVWHLETLLLERDLAGGVRTGGWVPLLVEVAHDALSVTAGRLRLVDTLPLPGWNPPPSWAVGFGATTTSQRDEMLLDNVQLHATTLLAATQRTVQLTLNGQQFHPTPLDYGYYGAASFPSLLSVSPSSGPIGGGTILSLQTYHADANLTLLEQDPRTLTDP
jgi:hypothetical protein